MDGQNSESKVEDLSIYKSKVNKGQSNHSILTNDGKKEFVEVLEYEINHTLPL
jgi:hypothetical protein